MTPFPCVRRWAEAPSTATLRGWTRELTSRSKAVVPLSRILGQPGLGPVRMLVEGDVEQSVEILEFRRDGVVGRRVGERDLVEIARHDLLILLVERAPFGRRRSSRLRRDAVELAITVARRVGVGDMRVVADEAAVDAQGQIGRASCRERV